MIFYYWLGHLDVLHIIVSKELSIFTFREARQPCFFIEFFILLCLSLYCTYAFLCFLVWPRESESIRLLSLQFLGRLLVGLPSEKKGSRFFNLPMGRSRSILESQRKIRMQPIFLAISDRLFSFPQTDNLCATLFDVLLGGASPKQVMCHMDPSLNLFLLVQYSFRQ